MLYCSTVFELRAT